MLTHSWPCKRCVVVGFRHLTFSTLRLNSRDSLRDRPSTSRSNHGSNPDNGINLPSLNNAYGTKSGAAGVSVTVHRSTTANFARNKSDNDVEPTFEVPKTVRSLRILATPSLILIYVCRIQISAPLQAKIKLLSGARRVLARLWHNTGERILLTLLVTIYPWSHLSRSFMTVRR